MINHFENTLVLGALTPSNEIVGREKKYYDDVFINNCLDEIKETGFTICFNLNQIERLRHCIVLTYQKVDWYYIVREVTGNGNRSKRKRLS